MFDTNKNIQVNTFSLNKYDNDPWLSLKDNMENSNNRLQQKTSFLIKKYL